MKNDGTIGGTLKLEIIKPTSESWDEVGARMRALRRSLAPALNATQRYLIPDLFDALEAIRRKEPGAKESLNGAKSRIRKTLQEEWIFSLERVKASDEEYASNKKNWKDGKAPTFYERTYLPVISSQANATSTLVASRWSGDHLKDLLASKSSVPSWTIGAPFSTDGRDCEVYGPVEEARLKLPLWGTGSKATELAVAVCGKGHEAIWRDMTDPDIQARRAALQKERRDLRKGPNKSSPRVKARISEIDVRLQKMAAYKIGSVGIRYDERKKKWYALVSWTQEREVGAKAEGTAALHVGINRLFLLMSQDGKILADQSGSQVLAVQKRLAHRRHDVQRAMPTMGGGSRGRGQKRRNRALDAISDKEARFRDCFNKQAAARVARACREHGIGNLILEDMSGIREEVERKEKGEMRPEKRVLVHSWDFYDLRSKIERACEREGVAVRIVEPLFVSQDCPDCGNRDPENVKVREFVDDVRTGSELGIDKEEYHGRLYVSKLKRTMFKCTGCTREADGDVVACVNHLRRAGFATSLDRIQTERTAEIVGLMENRRRAGKERAA